MFILSRGLVTKSKNVVYGFWVRGNGICQSGLPL